MKKLTLLLLAVCFGLLNLMAEGSGKRVVLNGTGDTKIQLVSDDAKSTTIEFNVNGYSLERVEKLRGNSYVVNLPQGSFIQEKGAPDLSKLTTSVIVSETNQMNLDIISSEYVEIKNIDIAPSRGNLYRNMDLDKIPYTEGKQYQQNEFYPGKLAELRDPYIVRDFRGQTIVTYPLQYNPVTKVLRIYTSIQVRVNETSLRGRNPLSRVNIQGVNADFSALYSHQFANYSKTKYEPVSEIGNMLIVCHPDYMTEIAPFVDWKTKKGIPVELVEFGEATGSSADDLKTYVTNYYTENGLTYLLLVGDAEDIPSLYSSGDSDVAYSYVSGDDHYPDFFVGRFSAENGDHVTSQVNKVIYYERDIDETASWLSRGMGIASDEGGGGQGDDGESDIQHMDNIKADLINYGYTYVAEVYDPGASPSDVATDVNEGVSVINYVGHGSDYSWVTSGFGTSDCDALTNVNKYPYIFDVACVNGNFHGQTCFAEAWARATHNGDAAGSVAIMASTINQSWAPPMDGQDEMVDLLVESYEDNIKRSFGGIGYNGCMHMNDEYGSQGDEMTDTWTVFGDPSLIVRTMVPEQMAISHDSEILIGVGEIEIDVDAEDAMACLSLDGEVIGVATVNEGVAVITFEPLTEVVDLDLVITGHNKVTYQGTVSVIPADGPYLSIDAFTVVDEDASGTVEYGESFNIDLTLENVGTETSESITATITTDDPYVLSISENTAIAFPNIASGETATIEDKFVVQLRDSVPDQYMISFTVTLNDSYSGKQEYVSTKKVKVNAPVIEFIGISYNDNFEGNVVNGIIDAGETGEVIFMFDNKGHADLLDVSTELSLVGTSEYLTLNTTMDELGELVQVSPTGVKFNVTAAENTPLAQHVPVNINVAGGSYIADFQEDVIIGIIPIFEMGSEDIITACSGTFLDDGGEEEAYTNGANQTMTFKPSMAGNMLQFTFEQFEVESGYDYLYVYNGMTADAEQVAGSPFSGSNVPGIITGANADGALTFVFTSDGSVNQAGWIASFECVDATAAPECATNPFPAADGTEVSTSLTLSWDAAAGAVSYDVYFGETLPTEASATISATSYELPLLDAYTTYQWKVIPRNLSGDGPEEDCGYWEFTTGQPIVIMQDGTVNVCEGIFMDPMGAENYEGNSNYTMTIQPDVDGKMTQVEFIDFAVEAGYDYLYIYDGTSASSDLIGQYDGSDYSVIGNDGVVTASNTEGALTFKFTSDGIVNYAGWEAVISCVDAAETFALTFEVTDMSGVVAGAEIEIAGETLTTNAEGTASVHLVAGTYDYTVTADMHTSYSGEVTVVDQAITEAVELEQWFNVSFNVTDGETAIDSAVITMNSVEYMVTAGVAEMQMLPGSYNYTIAKEGYEETAGSFDVVDQDMLIDVTMIEIGINSSETVAFDVYPNPSNGNFTIVGVQVESFSLYNTSGVKLISAQQVENNYIELDALNEGLFIIQITTADNKQAIQRIQIVK